MMRPFDDVGARRGGPSATEALLCSLQWQSALFHVGQYCGRWDASTAGRGMASFHAMLAGTCWLHRPGHPPVALQAGDALFFVRDEPHRLSSRPEPAWGDGPSFPAAMGPTWPLAPDGTALACGFFQYRSALTSWLLASLPCPLLLPRDDASADVRAAHALFALMREEADVATQRSCDLSTPALSRLVDLLLLYLLRHAARQVGPGVPGPWALAAQPDTARLLDRVMADPAADWTAERMAATLHLSRAAFFRRFQQVAGEAPSQWLLRLRMVLAADRLQRGDSVEQVAGQVGYQSTSAFHRAFQRATGELPGQFRRDRAARDGLGLAGH